MHPTIKFSVLTGKNVIKTVLRIGLRGRSFQRSKVKGFAKVFQILWHQRLWNSPLLLAQPKGKHSGGEVYLRRSFFNVWFFTHSSKEGRGEGGIGLLPFISFHSLNVWEASGRMHFLLILFSLIFWINLCMCVWGGARRVEYIDNNFLRF